jgi:hypothetical protein
VRFRFGKVLITLVKTETRCDQHPQKAGFKYELSAQSD